MDIRMFLSSGNASREVGLIVRHMSIFQWNLKSWIMGQGSRRFVQHARKSQILPHHHCLLFIIIIQRVILATPIKSRPFTTTGWMMVTERHAFGRPQKASQPPRKQLAFILIASIANHFEFSITRIVIALPMQLFICLYQGLLLLRRCHSSTAWLMSSDNHTIIWWRTESLTGF